MKAESYWNDNNTIMLLEELESNIITPYSKLGISVILEIDDLIMHKRPYAYSCLQRDFGSGHKSAYKRVHQFACCNFSTHDGHPDINEDTLITEVVPCPIRFTCKLGYCTTEHLLSDREKEVVSFFAQGMDEEKIADLLFISKSTVHNHITNVYSKLSFTGQAHPDRLLVLYAIQNKII